MSLEVDPKVFPFLKALGYKRRKASLYLQRSVTLIDLNWSGGTRNTYHVVKLHTGETKSFSHFSEPAPWNNHREGATVDIPEGCAVVRTGFFCGKVSLAAIYMNAVDARLLGFVK